jgi:hypothetical protein
MLSAGAALRLLAQKHPEREQFRVLVVCAVTPSEMLLVVYYNVSKLKQSSW